MLGRTSGLLLLLLTMLNHAVMACDALVMHCPIMPIPTLTCNMNTATQIPFST